MRLGRRSRGLAALASATLALMVGALAVAQVVTVPIPLLGPLNWPGMENWSPPFFKVTCQDEVWMTATDRPTEDCYTPYDVKNFEEAFDSGAGYFIEHHHRSPDGLGPVLSAGTDLPTVRVYADHDYNVGKQRTAAGYLNTPDKCGLFDRQFIALIPDVNLAQRKHESYRVALHELYHAIDHAGPTAVRCLRDGVYRPYWISEGIPDAMVSAILREYVTNVFPVTEGTEAGSEVLGLRNYSLPLNFRFEDSPKSAYLSYRTSSFWYYLSRRFHAGDMRFLQDYLDRPAELITVGTEDWLRWLDDALKNDPRIGDPLYLVLPAFLTDMLAQGEPARPRMMGRQYDPDLWQRSLFGGCQEIIIGVTRPYVETEMVLDRLSGRCFSVVIVGMEPNRLISLKIGVLTEDQALADELSLGLAMTTDTSGVGGKGFNCGEAAIFGLLPDNIGGCLFHPTTGSFRSGGYRGAATIKAARMWKSATLEARPGPQQAAHFGGEFGGIVVNQYVITRVPVELTPEMNDGARDPRWFRIAVAIDTSELTVDGKSADSGAAGTTRTRAVGSKGLRPSVRDPVVVPTEGHLDVGAAAQILGEETAAMVEANSQMLTNFLNAMPGILDTGHVLFKVAEAEVTPLTYPLPLEPETLKIRREFSVLVENPLPEGATGTFPAQLIGVSFEGEPLSFYSPPEQPAAVTIEENSPDLFRARVEGITCIFNPFAGEKPEDCPRTAYVRASIIKPFNAMYDDPLIAEKTPGLVLYNKYNIVDLGDILSGVPDEGGNGGGGPGEPGPAPAGSGESSVATLGCSCLCPDQSLPDTPACRNQCVIQNQICPKPSQSSVSERLATQLIEFGAIIAGRDLPAQAKSMLLQDFRAQSEATRAYLLEAYRAGAL